MTDRLFDIDEVPEVPLIRARRRGKGAQIEDERLDHDYPPEWSRCPTCEGRGRRHPPDAKGEEALWPPLHPVKCPDCLGMGSVKARVRLEAGHRCVRCGHPFMPKHDAKMLGVEPSPGHWSPCDERCHHVGPLRVNGETGSAGALAEVTYADSMVRAGYAVEAEWRVLTVHHLDGDKANLRWWNLVSLDQRCHLEIQAKIVMDRVYPHPHSEWFRPYAAGFYAWTYLGEDLTRQEVEGRLDELLRLELDPAYGVT